jgi:CubicO group peptidase (beta-lactamase class C family)
MQRDSWSSRAHIALACLSSACLLLCACGAPLEVDIPQADREIENPAGLSWLSRSALDGFLSLNTLIGSHSGYVAMFARDGRVVHATTSGYADIESRRPMQLDTRFRMASMTKPVTAVAALLLIEEGRLGLDDPVERYIPAAGEVRVAASRGLAEDGTLPTVPLSRPLTVRHLLTFTAGIGSEDDPSDLGKLWSERDIYAGRGSLEERVNRILTAPLYEQPGETWRYGWSADVLARVVEVAAAEPFDRFLERTIFTPLGMSSTSFLPPEEERGDMAKVYTQDENKNLILVESPASDAVDWTPGGSGLVSTAGDYMRFALMLWNGGTYDGAQILSRQSVELMTQPHVPAGVLEEEDIAGLGWGLGLAVVVDADATPMIDRSADFWWSGYYGTTFFVSPETGLVGVVLTQNQPGPFSDRPYAVYLAQAFAFFGL